MFTRLILSHNDVGKLLLILSCANRKFDNLMLSANFKISHLLYKGLTDDLVFLKLIILKAVFAISPFLRWMYYFGPTFEIRKVIRKRRYHDKSC